MPAPIRVTPCRVQLAVLELAVEQIGPQREARATGHARDSRAGSPSRCGCAARSRDRSLHAPRRRLRAPPRVPGNWLATSSSSGTRTSSSRSFSAPSRAPAARPLRAGSRCAPGRAPARSPPGAERPRDCRGAARSRAATRAGRPPPRRPGSVRGSGARARPAHDGRAIRTGTGEARGQAQHDAGQHGHGHEPRQRPGEVVVRHSVRQRTEGEPPPVVPGDLAIRLPEGAVGILLGAVQPGARVPRHVRARHVLVGDLVELVPARALAACLGRRQRARERRFVAERGGSARRRAPRRRRRDVAAGPSRASASGRSARGSAAAASPRGCAAGSPSRGRAAARLRCAPLPPPDPRARSAARARLALARAAGWPASSACARAARCAWRWVSSQRRCASSISSSSAAASTRVGVALDERLPVPERLPLGRRERVLSPLGEPEAEHAHRDAIDEQRADSRRSCRPRRVDGVDPACDATLARIAQALVGQRERIVVHLDLDAALERRREVVAVEQRALRGAEGERVFEGGVLGVLRVRGEARGRLVAASPIGVERVDALGSRRRRARGRRAAPRRRGCAWLRSKLVGRLRRQRRQRLERGAGRQRHALGRAAAEHRKERRQGHAASPRPARARSEAKPSEVTPTAKTGHGPLAG